MLMPGRSYQAGTGYRYGFNGKEKDGEVKGEGAQYDYGFRIYDPRLGKFLSMDPLTKSYPWYTPYQFAGNKPIKFVDVDGLEEIDPITVVQQPKDKGIPGIGYTTARKTYFIVTSGLGALSTSERAAIDVNAINRRLNSTPNQPATMAANDLYHGFVDFSDKEYKRLEGKNQKDREQVLTTFDDPFVKVNVEFDVDIIARNGMTLEQATTMLAMSPARYGIIVNSIPDESLADMKVPGTVSDLLRDANSQFSSHAGGRRSGGLWLDYIP